MKQNEAKKDKYHETRKRRANSWLDRAKQVKNDPAVQVIFYWIAFEAMYAQHTFHNHAENKTSGQLRRSFIGNAVNSPQDSVLGKELNKLSGRASVQDQLRSIIGEHKEAVKGIVNLRQTDKSFWTCYNENMCRGDCQATVADRWEQEHNQRKNKIKEALESIDTCDIGYLLKNLFECLYVVRNQVFHGAHSLDKSIGINQVKWALELLSDLVPVFLEELEGRPDIAGKVPPFPRYGVQDQQYLKPFWMDQHDNWIDE